jgi:hypothetical protein
MNQLPTRALRTLTAAVLLAAAGAARADAFAQSILVIDNFRLLHSNGAPFTASDFSLLSGTSNASAGTQFNSVFASSAQTASLFSGIDLAQLQVGASLPARPENNFTPYAFMPASFGYADQRMAGSMITTDLGAARARIQTRVSACSM